MAERQDGVDWDDVSQDMAREILARGDLYLATQVQMAIAADQRATTAASILASMATAIAAAFIAFWDKSNNLDALIGGLVGAAFLLVGAGIAAWAARPTDFEASGNHPSGWYAGRKKRLAAMIGGEAESVQRRILKNDITLVNNQKALRNAFKAALLAPVAAVGAWGISLYF
jgi:hypothetical protein